MDSMWTALPKLEKLNLLCPEMNRLDFRVANQVMLAGNQRLSCVHRFARSPPWDRQRFLAHGVAVQRPNHRHGIERVRSWKGTERCAVQMSNEGKC